jgi:hypothetical protein
MTSDPPLPPSPQRVEPARHPFWKRKALVIPAAVFALLVLIGAISDATKSKGDDAVRSWTVTAQSSPSTPGTAAVQSSAPSTTKNSTKAAPPKSSTVPRTPKSTLAKNQQAVSRGSYGEGWPFTVDSGILKCVDGAVTFESADVVYALNGTARARDAGIDIDDSEIWQDDPAIPGAKLSLDIISDGLILCN